jgi:soluble lytic murein transglycosylase-like protein
MVPARHLTAPGPAPTPPSLRTTVIASAAAVGAVATGTFTALVPTPGDGTATTAAADEAPVNPALAAMSIRIPSTATAVGALALVEDGAGFTAADQHLVSLGKASDLAAKLAEQLAKEQAAQAERARVDSIVDKGGLDGWIAEALRVLDLPQSLAPGVKKIIMAESGGNPRAINNWDANARRGTPSQGLMQTIPSTFHHYVAPELAGRPVTDPVANITAGLRYMIDNYGLDTVVAGGRSNGYGGYVGY